jgi:flagellar basal body-associated protein FliL
MQNKNTLTLVIVVVVLLVLGAVTYWYLSTKKGVSQPLAPTGGPAPAESLPTPPAAEPTALPEQQPTPVPTPENQQAPAPSPSPEQPTNQ